MEQQAKVVIVDWDKVGCGRSEILVNSYFLVLSSSLLTCCFVGFNCSRGWAPKTIWVAESQRGLSGDCQGNGNMYQVSVQQIILQFLHNN